MVSDEIPSIHIGNSDHNIGHKKHIFTGKAPLEIVEETEVENQQNKQIETELENTTKVGSGELKIDDVAVNVLSPTFERKRRVTLSYNKRRRSSSRRRSVSMPTPSKVDESEPPEEVKTIEIIENPKEFYLRKRRQSQIPNGTEPPPPKSYETVKIEDSQDLFSPISSIQSSLFPSVDSVLSKMDSKEDVDRPTKLEETVNGALKVITLNQILADRGFLKSGSPSFFDIIHDRNHRAQIYSPYEIYKYRTTNDIGLPHDPYTELPIDDSAILAFEKDPSTELDKLNFLIKSSTAPVPSNFRRRGYILMRIGKFEDAIIDFDKSLVYGNFFRI